MIRLIFGLAFLLGAAAVILMGANFYPANTLALSVTVVIGLVYAIGAIELRQFRRATATLDTALSHLSASVAEQLSSLDNWLSSLHPSLAHAVRARCEGEATPLPSPVLTPYLVSLLVMLGLLGTFVGLVETLRGVAVALDSTVNLEAIRQALSAPIGGLQLAFGTSVAGVAASAMLGLMSVLSRRDRILAVRRLDQRIAGDLQRFSLTHQRRETFIALRTQSESLPQLGERLQALTSHIEQLSERMGEQLISNQAQFHASAHSQYRELAESIDHTLRNSVAKTDQVLQESARLVGESVRPVLQQAIAQISQDLLAQTDATQQQIASNLQAQIETLSADVSRTSQDTAQALQETGERAATRTVAEVARLLTATETLVEQRIATEQTWLEGHDQRLSKITDTLREQLSALRDDEAQRVTAATERMQQLEALVETHLARLGQALQQPMNELIETAAQAPRAAAEVIGQLRQEVSKNIERDNQLLVERKSLLSELHSLSDSLAKSTTAQSAALENLVTHSQQQLSTLGEQVVDQVSRISEVADQFALSAVEIASLGESFAGAMQLYRESNTALSASLQQVQHSLGEQKMRSDEQLAYYVAQARELIDYTVLTQQQLVEQLGQLAQSALASRGEEAGT